MIPDYSPYGQNDAKSPYAWARPDRPTCKCPMDDVFICYNSSSPHTEKWVCARCHFEKPKFVVEPPKSSIVISFSQPEPRNIPKSPVPIDETAHFDNLNPAQKIEKLLGLEPLTQNSGTNRPKPTKYFCKTCNRERTTLGTKCPVCKTEVKIE